MLADVVVAMATLSTCRAPSLTVRCQALPAPQTRGKYGKQKDKRKGTDKYVEEEIYNIDSGWKVPLTEEMIEIAGAQVPVRLKQQLKSERRLTKQAAAAPVVAEPPPRLKHKLLRVMAGKAGNRKLFSPADQAVRPMMEVVRGAVFNVLQALAGTPGALPPGRWLDLYSGTGSVGIEALSRGCVSAHFVENDPWVVNQVLLPNLALTNFEEDAVVHTTRVETYLQQARDRGDKFSGGKFDFISVTPPYEAVSYTTLMAQLSESPLVGEDSCIVVEYPLKAKHEMPEECGPLVKLRDRRYGRTNVAIYGPQWAKDD